MSENVNKKVEIHLTEATTLQTISQVGYDMQGRIVTRSNDSIVGRCYGHNDETNSTTQRLNFENIDFITLDKTDAKNLVDIITELMDTIYKMEDGENYTEECDKASRDAELLGEKGISYERMYDYLNMVCFLDSDFVIDPSDEQPAEDKDVKEHDD